MNLIFGDTIDDFLVVYLDELLVYSDSHGKHVNRLEVLLSNLASNDLYVRKSKCEIMTTQTEFIGLHPGTEGIYIEEKRNRVVKEWPKPCNLPELRYFIELLQCFTHFTKHFSHKAAPLKNLTRKGIGIPKWNEKCKTSFNNLKEMLCNSLVIQPTNWELPFHCHMDAFELAVGGTLSQVYNDGHEWAMAFFSKRLSQAEENFLAYDREILGSVNFLKRFRCYLEGSKFEVITDNQVLGYFFTETELSRRDAR